jgi:perosamine synthetase
MRELGIETRPVVYPMHQLPPYQDAARDRKFPVANRLAERGINLPTWAGLTREDVSLICRSFIDCLAAKELVAAR